MPIQRIKIGTYNVNNFFDRFDNPYNQQAGWGKSGTKPKNLRDIFNLAQRLREDKPHIMAFQEIENKGSLDEFNTAHLGDAFDDIVVVEGNDPRGIQVGLASKLPLGKVVSYQFLRDFGDPKRPKLFSRDLLEVDVLDPKTYVTVMTLFVTHLKSKFINPETPAKDRQKEAADNDYRRERQALAISYILKQRFPDPRTALYAVMGDFNDTPDSAPLAPLLKDRDLALFDVLSGLPSERRWTHYWPEQRLYSQIDYILLSPALRERMVAGTAHVVQRGNTGGSDHRPVYVDLNVGWEGY